MNKDENRKIRVLVVDDSALVRQTLTEVLSSDPGIEVIDTAADPYIAARKLQKEKPDVITLDIEMPKMDGITFLRKIMAQCPIPVVICSSIAGSNSDNALKALEYGAISIIEKPLMGQKRFFLESKVRLVDAVRAASVARMGKAAPSRTIEPKLSADAVLPMDSMPAVLTTTEKVVAVGASTGGTEALRVYLQSLPGNAPGMVIVQHMPENFTAAFAKRLDSLCRVTVKEAEDGDSVIPGKVLLAPGNKHMLLKRTGTRYAVQVKDGPLVSRHRPSVDVLFRSAARYAGPNAVGVIMTGMGDDGAEGMREMKEAGGYTIAQDEESCVVFGMPREAIERGAVDLVLPLESIAENVLKVCARLSAGIGKLQS